MSAPVDSAPTVSEAPVPTSSPRSSAAPSPVAVVWCRQVDNEAESPGYTTVPEDFPGQRETLDIIRIVGNLTVNVADTHDYWDPDPSAPLSYYPNLFLYPAYGGRYTCVGRMFLSTEDRPRLGMKTLVLDTAQLLASGEFGATVLRWHASMGGPRRDGLRPPPVPDPNLFGIVGEGFLFHRGSTDPVLMIASDEWEPTMQVIQQMVRTLPASLVALGAILAFPYFLPQAKTNLHEFTEQVPLSLAVMRVGRGESAGDRHSRRLDAWESSNLTVRDLTDGVPSPGGRSKDSIPLVLQYVRDQNNAKLQPITQRVDLVEMGRLKQHLTDAERQGGKDRRKEMWRIGTAMESAALLLQRSRGRHVPVSADASKRAQEYMQARLPAGDPTAPPAESFSPGPSAPVVDAVAVAAVSARSTVPTWLQTASDPPAPAAPEGPEVVPMSVSDDPSLLRAGSASLPPPPPPVAATEPPAARLPDAATLKTEIQKDLIRFFDERLAVLTAAASREAARAMETRVAEETEAHLKARLGPMQTQYAEELRSALQGVEERSAQRLTELRNSLEEADQHREVEVRSTLDRRLAEAAQAGNQANVALRDETTGRLEELHTVVDHQLAQNSDSLAARWQQELREAVGAEVDRRTTAIVDPRIEAAVGEARAALAAALLAEVDRRVEQAVAHRVLESAGESRAILHRESQEAEVRLAAQVTQAITDLHRAIAAQDEESRATLAAQVEIHLAEATDRQKGLQQELEKRVDQAVARQVLDLESRRAQEVKELEGRLALVVDGRAREQQERNRVQVAEAESRLLSAQEVKQKAFETRLTATTEGKLNDLKESDLHSIAELQVRMQSYVEQRLKEGQDREREKYIELLARLKGELDAALPRLLDSPRLQEQIQKSVTQGQEGLRAESLQLIDQRTSEAEERLRVAGSSSTERLARLEADLAERNKELVRLEEGLRADLEELDRRTEILSDRLVPVVRKTWLRIAELEKANPNSQEADLRLNQLRREMHRELRRLEGELAERTGEIRDRMETSIANQGKVWLTLIRQLSELTEDRRRQAGGAAPAPRVNPMAPSVPVDDEEEGLDDLPELLEPRGRHPPHARRAPPADESDDDLDLREDDEDDPREIRRKNRRSSSR